MMDKIKYILDERNFEQGVETFFRFGYKFIPSDKDSYRDILTKANIEMESDKYIPRVALYSATVTSLLMIFVAVFIPVITLVLQLNTTQILNILQSLDFYEEIVRQPVIQSILSIINSISIPDFIYILIGIVSQPILLLFGFVESFAFELTSLVIYLLIFVIIFTIGMLAGWYYPIYVTSERKRDINNNLPYSITYMYSIVSGGRDVVGMLEVLSEQEDVYGEVANEAKLIINRTRLGDDIKTALLEQSRTTPSDQFQELLQDLVDLLEHTTDVESFFQNKTDESLFAAQQSIENKYALLEYLNVFITVLNFIPGMIVVLGIMASILQGSTSTGIFISVPALILITNAMIFGILYLLLGNTEGSIPQLNIEEPDEFKSNLEESEMPNYIKSKFKDIENDETFIDKIIENPWYGFLITLPLSAPYTVLALSQFSMDLLETTPTAFSIAYIMLPLFLILIGYTVLYELKYRRKKKVRDQLENMFRNVRDKNRKGIGLIEAFKSETESKRNSFEKTLNEYIHKTALTPITVKYALEKAANDLNVTRFKRSVRLLTDTIEETGQVGTILSIVVEDLKARGRINQSRVQQANETIVSIQMSDAILLVVLVIIDVFLITQFRRVQEQIKSLESARGAAAADLANLNFDIVTASIVYATVLVFIMGGLQTGYLRTGNLSSGIKYMLVMPTVAILVLIII